MNISDLGGVGTLKFRIVPSYDAKAVDCRVTVSPEGMLSRMGHVVTLQVTELTLEVSDDDSVTAEFDVSSLRVVSEGPSPSEREEIQRNAENTLDAGKYPKIRFRSTSVQRDGDRARIQGDLTIHGVTNSISTEARNDGQNWNAELTLDQKRYNITPYSKMGMLKVKSEVEVKISVPST